MLVRRRRQYFPRISSMNKHNASKRLPEALVMQYSATAQLLISSTVVVYIQDLLTSFLCIPSTAVAVSMCVNACWARSSHEDT